MFLCKVPSAWQSGTKPKKIKDVEDGNSRNGYHKVKCQVPETEELQGREKGRKKKKSTINQYSYYDKKKKHWKGYSSCIWI